MDARMWDERYAAADMVWSLEPNQFVVEYLRDMRPGTMLDVAGGEGRNALWFARRGWAVEVVEFSAAALAKFDERAEFDRVKDRCVSTLADVTDAYDTLVAPANLVVMAYLQIPAEPLARAIAQAASHLKNGGTFFGVWHDRENLEHGWGGPRDEIVLPTVLQIRESAESAGLVVERLEQRTRAVTTADGDRVAIDLVVLASRKS